VSRRARIALKVAVWGLCLAPLAALGYWVVGDDLTANPISFVTNHLGDWTFRILLASLAMTPLRILSGWGWPALLRRLLGLFAFAYALLHFSVWILLDHFFNWGQMLEDIVKRPYITVGMTALLLMLPLALTSTTGMVKRLGGVRWRRLHRLVYVVGTCAALHFLWLAKVGRREQYVYAGILTLLLAIRLGDWARRRLRRTRTTAEAQRSRSITEPRRSFLGPPTAQACLAAPATTIKPAPGRSLQ
jgi:sulfoxide reductase heme-binding subunit YedZ